MGWPASYSDGVARDLNGRITPVNLWGEVPQTVRADRAIEGWRKARRERQQPWWQERRVRGRCHGAGILFDRDSVEVMLSRLDRVVLIGVLRWRGSKVPRDELEARLEILGAQDRVQAA